LSRERGVATASVLAAPGRRQLREVRTASSYLSQSETTLHFGLGTAARAERVDIHWPDGARSALRDLPAGRRLRIRKRERPSDLPVAGGTPGSF